MNKIDRVDSQEIKSKQVKYIKMSDAECFLARKKAGWNAENKVPGLSEAAAEDLPAEKVT